MALSFHFALDITLCEPAFTYIKAWQTEERLLYAQPHCEKGPIRNGNLAVRQEAWRLCQCWTKAGLGPSAPTRIEQMDSVDSRGLLALRGLLECPRIMIMSVQCDSTRWTCGAISERFLSHGLQALHGQSKRETTPGRGMPDGTTA